MSTIPSASDLPPRQLPGLVAATHTPFHADGTLNLGVVERQAARLLRDGIQGAFVCGTTGEWSSLACEERRQLTDRWMDVTRGTALKVIVHVGGNCLGDAQALAAHAQARGAAAIAAIAPSYFKPGTVDELVDWCAAIAGAASATPFYYYDYPALTGVALPMPESLERAADRIPNFVGLKYSGSDMVVLQNCLRMQAGRYDVLWGYDDYLLAALALGVRRAVGSSYNFAAPIYHRLIGHFETGDLAAAREEQFRSVRMLGLLASYGNIAAAKAVVGMLGVDVGPPRLPIQQLTAEQITALRHDLERTGFFDWIKT